MNGAAELDFNRRARARARVNRLIDRLKLKQLESFEKASEL